MPVKKALDDFLMSDMSATFEDSDSEIDYSPIANSLRESQVNPLRESQVDPLVNNLSEMSIKQKYSPNEKINCSCGMTYTRTNKSRHLKKYHSTAEEIMSNGYVYKKQKLKSIIQVKK